VIFHNNFEVGNLLEAKYDTHIETNNFDSYLKDIREEVKAGQLFLITAYGPRLIDCGSSSPYKGYTLFCQESESFSFWGLHEDNSIPFMINLFKKVL
jgi:hypothetical protein